MAVAESFRRLGRIGDHEGCVGVRQVEREVVDLAFDAADNSERFAKVRLRMARRMYQRHEHLLGPPAQARHVILHDRDLAREAVLVAQPLEDPLARVALLLRTLLVRHHDRIDHADKRIELGAERRLRPHISRWHRELQHFRNRPGVDTETVRCRPHTDPFDQNRVPNPRIKLHCLHPHALGRRRHRALSAALSLRQCNRTNQPLL